MSYKFKLIEQFGLISSTGDPHNYTRRIQDENRIYHRYETSGNTGYKDGVVEQMYKEDRANEDQHHRHNFFNMKS